MPPRNVLVCQIYIFETSYFASNFILFQINPLQQLHLHLHIDLLTSEAHRNFFASKVIMKAEYTNTCFLYNSPFSYFLSTAIFKRHMLYKRLAKGQEKAIFHFVLNHTKLSIYNP